MTLKTLAACGLVSLAMTATASAGWIDDYNAQMNAPAANAKYVKSMCTSTAIVDTVNCGYYKKNGAPVHDVRYGIVAGSILVGGIAGGALHAHHHIHILGWKPTFVQAVGVGAVTGGVVATVATRR